MVQDLATRWISLVRVKEKPHRRRTRVCESSSNRHRSQRLSTQTTLWNLENPVKNYHGITELLRLIDPRPTELPKRAVRRVEGGTSTVLLHEKWWADSMEYCCYLLNVQDLLADGTTPYGKPLGEGETGHRYAVIVQNLATQWLYRRVHARQRLHVERKRVCQNFSRRKPVQKRFTQTIHWNLAKPVKICCGIIVLRRSIVPRKVVLAERSSTDGERRYIRSAILLQSGLDETWCADSMECYCCLRNAQDLMQFLVNGFFFLENHLVGQIIPFRVDV